MYLIPNVHVSVMWKDNGLLNLENIKKKGKTVMNTAGTILRVLKGHMQYLKLYVSVIQVSGQKDSAFSLGGLVCQCHVSTHKKIRTRKNGSSSNGNNRFSLFLVPTYSHLGI